jgi:hypothetical protein
LKKKTLWKSGNQVPNPSEASKANECGNLTTSKKVGFDRNIDDLLHFLVFLGKHTNLRQKPATMESNEAFPI